MVHEGRKVSKKTDKVEDIIKQDEESIKFTPERLQQASMMRI